MNNDDINDDRDNDIDDDMNDDDMNDDDMNDDDMNDDERIIDEDGADQATSHQDDTDPDDPGRFGPSYGPPFGPGFLDALKDFAEYSGFDLGGGPRGSRRGGPGQRGPGPRGPGQRSDPRGHDGPGRHSGPGERGGHGEHGGRRGPGGPGGHRGPGGRGRGGRPGDFGGFPGRPGSPGRPQRARKGDVKAAILSLLAEEPHNGYRLIKAIARMTDGAWRPSPGSVYPTLQQMLEEGLIAAVGGEGNRSDYGLTDEGRSYVAQHVADLKTAWESASGTTDEDLAMHESIRKLTGAVQQAALAATEEQSGKIAEILDDARRAVYRVLAD